jgi:class 3 adenylate cyclase/predicted ATPase
MSERTIRTEKHLTIVEAHPYHRYVSDDWPRGNAIVERVYDARCPRCREETVVANPRRLKLDTTLPAQAANPDAPVLDCPLPRGVVSRRPFGSLEGEMQCPRCQTENREGRRFCSECGVPLAFACPSCGFLNEGDAKFCGGCGKTLISAPAMGATAEFESTRLAPEAERRQLSVMFCDLAESTRLSGRLDPEVLREVVRSYQHVCSDVIGHFRGHVAQYLGDGILAYFGYPTAHDDDAQGAVRAALGILGAMQRLNIRLARDRGITLAVRLGIHTGLVVVGEVGSPARQERLALGETPNVAARLQALAETDSVVISDATYRLVRGAFLAEDLGAHAVKGVSAPVHAYRILGESEAHSHLDAPTAAITPLVGREEELGLLLGRWERVSDGLGQVVLIGGEPGIGKSRLVRALKEHIGGQPHLRWECRCSAYHHDSALYPMIDLFERALGFGRDEPPDDKLAKVKAALDRYGLARPETVALWAALLSVPLPQDHSPLQLPRERQKQKTLEAILALLLKLAAEQPVLFIVEDAHWVDPSTRELLDLVLEQVATVRILMLLTFRPEFRLPWGHHAHLTHLTLGRLTRRQTGLMVERVTGGKPLPAEVREQVIAKTDGVPLFVEELTKMVVESGLLEERAEAYELSGALPPLTIPSTLQDSLMARLDRLATVKDVAQLAAALGRSFSYELLAAVASIDASALEAALARLVDAELVYQRGVLPDATYVFKHALIQETAYQSMLISRRQGLHERIAATLVERFPDTSAASPELVAHHYTEAGLLAEAAEYWHRAGQRAVERGANAEAAAHLSRALDILAKLPEDADHLAQELDVLTALGPAFMATRGFGSPEVATTYARARDLCQRLGATQKLFDVLRGLWEYYELRADAETGRQLADQILDLAERSGDRTLLVIAHDVVQDTSLWLGDYRKTRHHAEQALALYDRDRHRSLAFLHGGYDPAMACGCFSAHALWYLGYPDQALARSRDALALARDLNHPPTLVFALSHAAVLHQFRGETSLAAEKTEEALALAREHGFEFWRAHAAIPHGWALACLGRVDEGLAEILDGLARYRATGSELERSLWVALLVDAYVRADRPEPARDALEEALADVDKTGVRFHEADLYRLWAELLLRLSGRDDEATAALQRAIEIAQARQAKSLELRATLSLSRLLQREGKRDDARRMLGEIHGWFTEGFDTADLKDAKAVLRELT